MAEERRKIQEVRFLRNGRPSPPPPLYPSHTAAIQTPVADIAIITPAIHYTMGGVRIDADGRALGELAGKEGVASPIPGLYAAGEVTGGVHGANRLAGNSLLECVVIGRLAGQHAGAAAVAQLSAARDDVAEGRRREL